MLTDEEIKSFLAGKKDEDTNIRKVQFPSLRPVKGMDKVRAGLSHLEDIQIDIMVELGQVKLKTRDVLGLTKGSVIKLDKAVGDYVEIIMNQQRFARGEVIIINDTFGVRVVGVNRAQKIMLDEDLL